MTDCSRRPRPPGLPALPRPKLAIRAARRPPCCSSASAPSAPPRVFKHLKEEEIEQLSLEMARPARSRWTRARPSGTSSSRPSWPRPTSPRAASSTPARSLERSLGPDARQRADRPPVGHDRAPAVRVPAPLLARADLRLPAQRGPADDRRRHREPAHDPRRRGALAAAARAAGRGRPARRHDDRDQPGRHARRRGRAAPEAVERRHPRVLLGGRRRGRWPTSSTTPTARPSATSSTRSPSATPSSPTRSGCCSSPSRTSSSSTTAASSSCSRASTPRTSGSRCAASTRRRRTRIFSNMSERGAEMLREEMEFQPAQKRSVVEEAQGRIVGVDPPPRGVRRDHHQPRRRR